MSYMTGPVVSVASDNCIEKFLAQPFSNEELDMTGRWPLRSFLELGAYVEAVRCARLHAQLVLLEWGFGERELAETCLLVVSELVTNSVQASYALDQFTTVRLWLYSDKEKVLIYVGDALAQPPDPHASVDDLAESGRGLFVISVMTEQWGWYPVADGGKVVWALCGEAMV